MLTSVRLANTPVRVKPERVWQRGNQQWRVADKQDQAA
jgi:hypothetical protein